jgi:acyl-CoA synthetase (AMP-forming)/AMP-acid ligase II
MALALLFDLDIDVIAAILGVVKMGKVYVALDPSSPRVRNDDILRELQANLILTNRPTQRRCPCSSQRDSFGNCRNECD